MDGISARELPQRDGVELIDMAGVDALWPMPVALWNAPKGFDTRARPDHRPCHVIAFRLAGSLVQRIGEQSLRPERLRPNGFSVHPAHCELRFVAPSAIRFAHIYVPEAFLSHIAGNVSVSLASERLVGDQRVMYEDAELTAAIEAYVNRAFDRTDLPTRLEMESRANLIAIRFLQRHLPHPFAKKGTELAPWQVQKVSRYLEDNLDRNVTLTELSSLIDLSPEHVCRAFKRATGLPPQRWAIRKRMEAACRLLAETDTSLTSIAQEVGYAGQSAFGTVFRNALGVSPGQYRRNSRQE
ncbi:Helix-turn-helix transcriptional regulator [Hyphomicrobiales bacterium]|nr:Helix-turn-helix transcriptional regulator [Hyphomicrobiales bacterium]CAH1697357.1 Helix-turn-helix transcriptional regulator [Hyphomicrobiales bacterium]CAI0345545.1 AraC family transcriptional regulator [Hyphomicrobiales bacterium]